MSVAVLHSTVLSPLWRAAEAGTTPLSVPLLKEGVFLSFHLAGDARATNSGSAISTTATTTAAAAAEHEAVTFVAFHPVDETCFVFGTTSGKAYGVSLQDNKLFLLADLSGGPLRCGIFCPGYLTSPIVVLVQAAHRLIFVDWQRGTVVQESVAATHTQAIVRLLTGPSTESLICAVSSDAFSCWEPVREKPHAASVGSPIWAGSGVKGSETDATTAASRSAAAATEGAGTTGSTSTAPRYSCTSAAVPAQRTRGSALGQSNVPMHTGKGVHRLLGLHVMDPSLLLSVESNNTLSLWSRRADFGAFATSNVGEETTVPDASGLRLLDSVTAPPTLRVRCSALCGDLVALGADAVATSKHGPVVEPVVAFVHARTLAGAGVVRLPAGDGSSASRATPTVAVVEVSAVHDDLVACLLSTGIVHVVVASTYHLVFTIQPPATVADAVTSAPWSCVPSGPTFAAMFREHTLVLLHLPSARQEYALVHRTGAAVRDVVAPSLQRLGEFGAAQRRASPVKAGPQRVLSQQPSLPRSAVTTAPAVTLALPFLRHPRSTKPSFSTRSGAADPVVSASSLAPEKAAAELTAAAAAAAALHVLAVCRAPTAVPKKGFAAQWVDVNLVDMRFSDADGIHAGDEAAPEKGDETSSALSSLAPRAVSEQTMWAEAKFCDTLSAASCQYNLEQLQAHLRTFGVFPHAYRRFTWRFLAGLPTKARTASQFAAVARRPKHVAVDQLMRPFPLPHNATRRGVEEALSCLCWAAPVLTLASYLPVLVYPLVMLYRDDVQTVVELVLLFFANWGKEFFVCHPRGPTSVLTAMERELSRLDGALCQHLTAVGATVEVWGWELMTSFYTDVLTGAEWLQVMDHALAASPLWLYAFHLSLLRTRLRASLMSAVSADEARRVLSHTAALTPATAAFPLKVVLEDAYRLHGDMTKAVESGTAPAEVAAYTAFCTLTSRFEYPSDSLPHDPVILAEKMRELALVQRSREEEAAATKRYTALRTEAAAAAAKEATFLQQQRVRAAAKYDASAAAWQVQVALEKGRQAQEAQEQALRWEVVQRRTRNAEDLATLHTEINTVTSQLRHDMVDRHMEQLKWGLATHLTGEELARLQQSAELQMETAVRHIDRDVVVQEETLARFHNAPVLQCEPFRTAKVAEKVGHREREEQRESPRTDLIEVDGRAGEDVQDGYECGGHELTGTTGATAEENVREEAEAHDAGAVRCDSGNADAPQRRPQDLLSGRHAADTTPSSTPVHDTTQVAMASGERLSEAVGNESEGAVPAPEPETQDEVGALDAAHTRQGNAAMTLYAATERCTSPSEENRALPQPRLHDAARYGTLPMRRHHSHRADSLVTTTTTTTRSASSSTAPSPTLQSFVELRNRVLQRLQPTNANERSYSRQKAEKPHVAFGGPGRRDPAHTAAHPSTTSTSYTDSHSYESGASRTTTTATTASQATTYATSATVDSRSRASSGVGVHPNRIGKAAPRTATITTTPTFTHSTSDTRATSAATDTAESTLWSKSYSTSYSSYDYYGTGRTTESTTSSSHHTSAP